MASDGSCGAAASDKDRDGEGSLDEDGNADGDSGGETECGKLDAGEVSS